MTNRKGKDQIGRKYDGRIDQISNIESYFNSFASDKYYTVEIIPINYQSIYGKWKLFKKYGGIMGASYEPDFDKIKSESKKLGSEFMVHLFGHSHSFNSKSI